MCDCKKTKSSFKVIKTPQPKWLTYIFWLLLHCVSNKSHRCRWQDLDGECDQHCRRPSDVYDTHRRTKLTAPETISRSTDTCMVGAHQNLNGSRDLITSLSGMAYRLRLTIATDDLPTKFEVSIVIHYEDMKGDTKCRNGVIWGS